MPNPDAANRPERADIKKLPDEFDRLKVESARLHSCSQTFLIWKHPA
jgi:hypothetical protein